MIRGDYERPGGPAGVTPRLIEAQTTSEARLMIFMN